MDKQILTLRRRVHQEANAKTPPPDHAGHDFFNFLATEVTEITEKG
jgi:hypothetical protein